MYWKYQVEDFGIFVLLCIDDAVFLMLYFLHIKPNKEMYGIVTDGTHVYVYTLLFQINRILFCSWGQRWGG